jgi:methyl-accepting chemotaxis protein
MSGSRPAALATAPAGRRGHRLDHYSIKTRLAAVVCFFVAVLGGLVVMSQSSSSTTRTNAVVDNVAGRQPMLVERYLKEVILVSNGFAADPEATRDELNVTAKALLEGGKVRAVQGNDKEVQIPAATDSLVRAKLQEELKLIGEFVVLGEQIRTSKPGTASYNALVIQAEGKSHLVANVGHDAVGRATLVAEAASSAAARRVGLLALFGAIVGSAVGWLLIRSILGVLRRMAPVYRRLAEGDLTASIPDEGGSELAALGGDLNRMVDGLRATVSTIDGAAANLAESSVQLASTSADSQRSAQANLARAQRAAQSLQVARATAERVALRVGDVRSTTRDIAANAATANRVADDATAAAASITDTVSRLGNSSSQIGDVVSVISSVAQQTNLLALNATIEAARAGVAGKGFAVVAGEVKALAAQTAAATADIGNRIAAIQADISDTATVTQRIVAVINEIRDCQRAIAQAVETQAAAATGIDSEAHELVTQSQAIADDVQNMTSAATTNAQLASESGNSAAALAAMASTLQEVVGAFRYRDA